MESKVYEIITKRIIDKLEQGTVPWQQPWGGIGLPKNFISDKHYHGINTFLTGCQGFTSEYWITFKQAKTLKGSIKTGEKGTPVIYWNWLDRTVNDKNGNPKKESIPFLRYYTVFNLQQTEGIEYKLPEKLHDNKIMSNCQKVFDEMPLKPAIKDNSNKAFYTPIADYIGMPNMELFKTSQDYYSVLFHEMIHSTGHGNRLNRDGITQLNEFGSYDYSKEELLAEMGASFLNGFTGIFETQIDNSASYIQSWLKKLRNDKKLVIHAGAQAQKACNYILNIKNDF